jgi:hypothetical protein
MHTMKSASYALLLLVASACIGTTGCNKPPKQPIDIKPITGAKEADVWRSFIETSRYSETSRAGDDWTRFRAAFDGIRHHFTKAEITERVRKVSTEQRKFLENDVHLTPEELAEVESLSFRTADAHYLDECFLLRDAAGHLEMSGASSVELAQLHFGWVMRNVLPHEQVASWIPPAFTLRRGCGGPLERALVFLALLRQAHIDGCLIVVPETEPTQFLVAALDSKSDSLHLFDPRLGMPLMNKGGTSVLSLKEALADPTLLKPAMISADQAKTLEAWLVCPLYALSPRMRELQTGLGKHDSIVLYLNAAELAKEIGKTTTLRVKVWNPPAVPGKPLPNSPTRELRLFLPKQEGGIDEINLAALVNRSRVPMPNVLMSYAQINLTNDLLGKAGFETLYSLSADFFNKYDLQPREMYLRGQFDSMSRRHERLQFFAKDDALIGLAQDRQFRKDAEEWRKQMRDANSLLGEAEVRAKAQQALNALWGQDQFIRWMLEINKEENLEREHKKTVVTRILAVGMRDYFYFELARLQAAANHEKAVQAQAQLRGQKTPNEGARKEARDAWIIAKSSWANFYLDRIALDFLIKSRLEQLQSVPIEPYDNFDKRVSLLETLHLDVQKYFQAQLRLAECFEGLDAAVMAKERLKRMKSEIEAMEKKGLLQAETTSIRNVVPQLPSHILPPLARPFFQKRLDLLAHDWSEGGSYYWMKQQIERKLGDPKKT